MSSGFPPDLGDVVVGADELQGRIAELGKEITADYEAVSPAPGDPGGSEPGALLLVGILKGAFMFMADLARNIDLPVEFEFMAVASYGSATKSSGVVRIVKDLDVDLAGRHVLLVEDIVDSGLTLNYLVKYLRSRQPASLEVCTLLLKEGQQKVKPDLRYVGFRIPGDFVVGYGLDAEERHRNLPLIAKHRGHGQP